MTTIYLTDRSRIDTREECERKRYLNYDFDIHGEMKGIQRKASSLPLLNGTEVHEAHARVLAHHAQLPGGLDVETAVNLLKASYRATVERRGVFTHAEGASEEASIVDPEVLKTLQRQRESLIVEQTALLEASLRAFERLWIPRLMEEYDILGVETPMQWNIGVGLVQNLRFDITARRKSDGQLTIIDYKTMKYLSDVWGKKLEASRQTSLYILAAQELYGEPVEMGYLGLITGAYAIDTAKSSPWHGQKIQRSPYLYAYVLRGDGDVYQTEYTAKKGYQKIRTYEEMSIKQWVDWLFKNEPNTVNELFTWNPPIAPTLREMEEDRELVVIEERRYVENIRQYHEMKRKAIVDGNQPLLEKAERFLSTVAAPKRRNVCFKYGEESQCPFYELICANEGGMETALEDGAFEVREPHHETELKEAA